MWSRKPCLPSCQVEFCSRGQAVKLTECPGQREIHNRVGKSYGEDKQSISKRDEDHGKLEHLGWELEHHWAVAVKAGGRISRAAGGHRG